MHYSDNEKRDIMLMNRKKTKNGYKNGWKRQSYLRQKRCRKNLSKSNLTRKIANGACGTNYSFSSAIMLQNDHGGSKMFGVRKTDQAFYRIDNLKTV